MGAETDDKTTDDRHDAIHRVLGHGIAGFTIYVNGSIRRPTRD